MRSLVIYRNDTALHMGMGIELGFIDMPIQRERTTGFPKAEASGIKGVFRDMCDEKKTKEWFGDERGNNEDNSDNMGLIRFTDARLLFFPVRTLQSNIFVWLTCPFIMARFLEDTKVICKQDKEWNNFKESFQRINDVLGKLSDEHFIHMGKNGEDESLRLMEYNFEPVKDINEKLTFPIRLLEESEGKYLKDKINQDLYMVSNEVFSYFVEMGTEVITRIKIGDQGVVEDGALFTEEFLPENTILYNSIEDIEKRYRGRENKEQEVVEELFKNIRALNIEENTQGKRVKYTGIMQLGGGKTIGKGITSFIANVYKER